MCQRISSKTPTCTLTMRMPALVGNAPTYSRSAALCGLSGRRKGLVRLLLKSWRDNQSCIRTLQLADSAVQSLLPSGTGCWEACCEWRALRRQLPEACPRMQSLAATQRCARPMPSCLGVGIMAGVCLVGALAARRKWIAPRPIRGECDSNLNTPW